MFNLKKPHYRSAIIANGDLPSIRHKLIHATGTQRRPDGITNYLAGIDIAD
jgi:hypothetical protein